MSATRFTPDESPYETETYTVATLIGEVRLTVCRYPPKGSSPGMETLYAEADSRGLLAASMATQVTRVTGRAPEPAEIATDVLSEDWEDQ